MSLLLVYNSDLYSALRAQWPFATHLYIADLCAYLQNIYKVKIYKTSYW